jgi:hypothetical protein
VFGGSLESGGWFCGSAFGMNLVLVAVKMFSHLMYFRKKFYKLCTLNTSLKNNAAINYHFSTQNVHSRQLLRVITKLVVFIFFYIGYALYKLSPSQSEDPLAHSYSKYPSTKAAL